MNKKQWENDTEHIIKYYTDMMIKHGYSAEALAARDKKYTNLFLDELFADIRIKNNASFLDIGSGLGFFIDYIEAKKIKVANYLGIDLIEKFVDYSKTNYPSYNFIQGNFISEKFSPIDKYDYVFALGVLVSKTSEYESYLSAFIKKMVSFSKEYVLFNLIVEIDKDSKNYENKETIGGTTCISKVKIEKLLDSFSNITYRIIEKKLFDDATDAFIQVKIIR